MSTHRWRKSTFSADTGDCVEVSHLGAVRDSKNPTGPVLPADLSTLLRAVKAGNFRS